MTGVILSAYTSPRIRERCFPPPKSLSAGRREFCGRLNDRLQQMNRIRPNSQLGRNDSDESATKQSEQKTGGACRGKMQTRISVHACAETPEPRATRSIPRFYEATLTGVAVTLALRRCPLSVRQARLLGRSRRQLAGWQFARRATRWPFLFGLLRLSCDSYGPSMKQ